MDEIEKEFLKFNDWNKTPDELRDILKNTMQNGERPSYFSDKAHRLLQQWEAFRAGYKAGKNNK